MQGSFSRRLLIACACAIGVSWARPCGADEATLGAPSPEARAHFEQGVRAFEQGRYRRAVELFLEADRLAPSARSRFNIAKVYERMGDERSALGAYRDYLRRLPAAENGADVARRITELERALQRQGVQQVSVLSTPSGAAVLIDEVSLGVTPWTGELRPGAHRLTLRLTEHRELQQQFELPAEHAIDVLAQLQPELSEAPVIPAASRVSAESDMTGSAIWSEPVAPWDALEPSPPREQSARAAPEPRPRAEPAAAPGWLTWTLLGTSASAMIAAGAFELSRQSMEERADSPIQVVHEDKYAAMQRRQTAARVLLGAGIATAVAGGVSLYFDLDAPSADPAELELACGPALCGLLVEGRF